MAAAAQAPGKRARLAAAGPLMRRLPVSATFLVPLALAVALVAASPASPSVDGLRSQIQHATQREQSLQAAAGGTSAVIATLTQQLSLLSGRVAALHQQLAQDRAQLSLLVARAALQRTRLQRLRQRLVDQRGELARWLVAVYELGRPTTLEVLTSAHGFADLLERMDFLHRLSEHGGQVTKRISAARIGAQRGLRQVTLLGAAQRQVTLSAAAESAALQSMSGALSQRRATLDLARQLQLTTLARTRSRRAALQGELAHQLAALAAPAPAPSSGAPGGMGFAIPWPIVQCESGGQNLPPNSAGASGYYQIVPATWKGAGGSTAQAYQAPKAEQDAVAARLWAGGAGASNWVCASLVGGH